MIGLAASVGGTARDDGDGSLLVRGLDAEQVGDLAFEHEIRLHELTPVTASLEQAFMDLTAASVDFRAGLPGGAGLRGGRPSDGLRGKGGLTWRRQRLSQGRRRRSCQAGQGAAGIARRDRVGLAQRRAVGVHQDPVRAVDLLDPAGDDRRVRGHGRAVQRR